MSGRPKPVRKLVTLSSDTARRLEDFRVGEDIRTESEAMLRLIVAGLGMADARAVAPWFTVADEPPTPEEGPRMTDHERLMEIENRAAKATEGPWDTEQNGKRGAWIGHKGLGNSLAWAALSCGDTDERATDNAEFIAHARSDIPYLLAQLRAVMEENARLREALQRIAEQKIRGEFTDEEWDDVDGEPAWEDGYTGCVTDARIVLATLNPPGDSTGEVG